MSSYRESHIAKGENYHKTFTDLPYRQLIWNLEQQLLDDWLKHSSHVYRYLDFACGTGRVLGHVESKVGLPIGVDVSQSMLDMVRTHCRRATVVRGDLTVSSCFPPRTFDLITAFRFFPNAEAGLREAAMSSLAQLLTAKGFVIFNNHRNRSSLRNLAKRVFRRGVSSGMTHADVVRMVRSAGLVIEQVYHVGLWPGSEFQAKIPGGLAHIERLLSRVPILRPWANDIVYVCRPLNASP